MVLLPNQSEQRAATSLRCLPFNFTFYKDAKTFGMTAETVFKKSTIYCLDRKKWFKKASSVEAAFRWLIKVGVLRREVDGQGLTSKVRLTPLGRNMLEHSPDLPSQKPKFQERFGIWMIRKLHWQ